MVLFGQLGCQGPRYTIKKYILTENASWQSQFCQNQNYAIKIVSFLHILRDYKKKTYLMT